MGKDKTVSHQRSNKFRNQMFLMSKNQKKKKKTEKKRKIKTATLTNSLAKDYFEIGKSANINYNQVGISTDPNKLSTKPVETLVSRKKKPEVDPQTKFLTELADKIQESSEYPFEISQPAPETSFFRRFHPEHLDAFATLLTHFEVKLNKKAEQFTENDLQMMTFSKLNIFQFSKAQLRGMVKAYVQDSKRTEELMTFAKETLEKERADEKQRVEKRNNLLEKAKASKESTNNPETETTEEKHEETEEKELEGGEKKQEEASTSPASAPKDEFKEMDIDEEEEEEEIETEETEEKKPQLTEEQQARIDDEQRTTLETKRNNNIKLTEEEKQLLKKIKRRQKKREAKRGITKYGETIVSNKTGRIVERVVPKYIEAMEVYTYKQRKRT